MLLTSLPPTYQSKTPSRNTTKLPVACICSEYLRLILANVFLEAICSSVNPDTDRLFIKSKLQFEQVLALLEMLSLHDGQLMIAIK